MAIAGALLALAWLLGVASAAFTGADPAATVAAASLLAALTLALRPRASSLILIAVGILLIVGATWRYDATQPSTEGTVAAFNETEAEVRIRGVVGAEPDERATGRLYRVNVREAFTGGQWTEAEGKILVRLPSFPAYEYGDLLELEGELEAAPVFPDFNYRDYLLRRGVVSLMPYPDAEVIAHDEGDWHTAGLIDFRRNLTDRLDESLPEPQSSLAAGILFGARGELPADLRDAMRLTGTSHLVAVSGWNVTILVGAWIAVLAWPIGRRPAAWASIAVIIGYTMLVGGQASVVRAAIMASTYVMSIIVGRQSAAPVGLAIAAAAMTAVDPQVVHDVGFQLSFAATIGLIALANPLRIRAEAAVQRWPQIADAPITRPAIETLTISLSAILFTLPITAVNFGQVSLVALPANLLAVPAFVAVAFTAGLVLLAGLFPGGEIVQWIAWIPATYMIGVIELMASVPGASVFVGGLGVWFAIGWYAVLGAGTWLVTRQPIDVPQPGRHWKQPRSRGATALATGVLVVAATAFVWSSLLTDDDGDRLSVMFLDVGQGDAVLIEGPDGNRILVDGGPSGDAAAAALSRALPFYDRRIDLLVLSHPAADHGGGLLEVLDSYNVGAVLDSPVESASSFALAWEDAVAHSGLPRYVAERGMQIDLGDGALLEVISPESSELSPWADLNDGSTVLRLTMGEVSFLLTGDIEEEAEATLVHSGTDLRATVLKVAHHGSRTSTTPAFLSRVAPSIDVISVGAENRFGHPTSEVLDRLSNDYVLRSDEDGDIEIETDGERIWVTTER
jgi:competence protein ComEC